MPREPATQITPAGFVDRPNERLHLLVDGRARTPAELALQPVRVLPDGGRILLGDVATVTTPPFRCETLSAPFVRLEWGARG